MKERLVFNKIFGEMVKDLGIVSDDSQDKIAKTQAILSILKDQDKKFDAYGNINNAENLVSSNNINDNDISQKINYLSENSAPQGVPLFGDIALKLGYISQELKTVCLIAQAAERVLLISEGKCSNLDTMKNGFENKDKDNKMFFRNFIDNETNNTLKQAQATHHLLDIICGFNATQTEEKKLSLGNTALILGLHYYEQADQQAKNGNINNSVTSTIEFIIQETKKLKQVGNISSAIEILKTNAEKILTNDNSDFSRKLTKTIDTRINQISVTQQRIISK